MVFHHIETSWKNLRTHDFIILGLIALVNGILIGTFMFRSWAPADEGYYAVIAEQILHGSRLGLEIEQYHSGLLHYVHALFFGLFGADFRVLRYPLMVLQFIQPLAVYLLFIPSAGAGVAAAAAFICLTLFQFLNPAAHWYCLFLTVMLIFYTRQKNFSVRTAGMFVGVIFLMRQLTGFFVYCALMTYLAGGKSSAHDRKAFSLSQGLLFFIGSVLCVYLFKASDLVTFLLMGIWPLLLIWEAMKRTAMTDDETRGVVLNSLIGVSLILIPFAVYQGVVGSFSSWFKDVFLRSLTIPSFPFIGEASYLYYPWKGISQIVEFQNTRLVVSGLYWVCLPLLSFINGCVLFISLRRKSEPIPALSCFAVFFALVSVHYQIPIYLYYSAALSLSSILWQWRKRTAVLAALYLSAAGFAFHAGQPIQRTNQEIVEGVRKQIKQSGLPKNGLRIPSEVESVYRELLVWIEKNSRKEDAIFVFPYNPEIYFMSKRKSTASFIMASMHMQQPKDYEEVVSKLTQTLPPIIIFNERDKYNTPLTRKLYVWVREHYVEDGNAGDFKLFRRLS